MNSTPDPQTDRFRKLPVEIEAHQWDGTADGATRIIDWVLSHGSTATYTCSNPDRCSDNDGDTPHSIAIRTLEGTMRADLDDWIIRGVKGEFYPCKPDVFGQTYEPASAVPDAPPTGQTGLRELVASTMARADGWEWAAANFSTLTTPTADRYRRCADAVLAVLPDTARLHDETLTLRADQAKTRDLLRSENQRANAAIDRETTAEEAEEEHRLALSTALGLGTSAPWPAIRERAAETPRPETQGEAEAHPAEHTWAAELHDPLADEWVPGTRYIDRDRAVNHLTHARSIGPTWKDGTPTERRLVRATTTYTVEQPAVVHSCGNCEGIDPGSCLTNPDRDPSAPDAPCPTPETHNWGCGCPSDVAAAIASCPGYEMDGPSPCRCPCDGCRHSCAAHQPAVVAEPGKENDRD